MKEHNGSWLNYATWCSEGGKLFGIINVSLWKLLIVSPFQTGRNVLVNYSRKTIAQICRVSNFYVI